MSEDDRQTPITQDDIDSFGVIECYSCDEPITIPPGGQWILMRPNTAYPFCANCLVPTPEVATLH